ncbi:MAG TPA: acyloxyacyl hydrolase [Burkholderiales bacterium]|nr:acyloxyacyl hydrolase [Burkholderiales bacterium]
MNNKLPAAAFFALCFMLASPARAQEPSPFASDGVSFEAGSGNGAEMWRIGVTKKWRKRWLEAGNWHLGGYWELQYGEWYGGNTIHDLGFTPVWRFQQTERSRFSPYVEAAIGFHLIQPVRLTDTRGFSTAFQFGDHVGAGVRFGERQKLDLGVRFQHLSNGGIKEPNNGINFTQVRLVINID